jgi:prolyl-tRNA synthetase
VVRRDLEDSMTDLVENIREILDTMQKELFERAREERNSCIAVAENWDDFMVALNHKKMVLAPWCDEVVSFCCTLYKS